MHTCTCEGEEGNSFSSHLRARVGGGRISPSFSLSLSLSLSFSLSIHLSPTSFSPKGTCTLIKERRRRIPFLISLRARLHVRGRRKSSPTFMSLLFFTSTYHFFILFSSSSLCILPPFSSSPLSVSLSHTTGVNYVARKFCLSSLSTLHVSLTKACMHT